MGVRLVLVGLFICYYVWLLFIGLRFALLACGLAISCYLRPRVRMVVLVCCFAALHGLG